LPARVESVRRCIRKHAAERAALRDTRSLMHVTKEDLMLSSVIQDTRFALRGMRRTTGFTFIDRAALDGLLRAVRRDVAGPP